MNSIRTAWKKLLSAGVARRATPRPARGRSAPAVEQLEDRSCPAGSVLGTKYDDQNGNGARDDGEPGVAGVTVYADINRNGAFDLGGVAEPDGFVAGQDLTTAVPGVTLNVVTTTTGTAPNHALRVRSNTDPFATTGSQVFFRDTVPTWTTTGKLRAEFAQPIGRVSIDFAAGTAGHIGRLEAYN
ncbi:MAG TPA: hypothetical protein VD866_17770, partial [Urbifossiella sp.]|nr:hypothetical protein [Urbifossiella sp.]